MKADKFSYRIIVLKRCIFRLLTRLMICMYLKTQLNDSSRISPLIISDVIPQYMYLNSMHLLVHVCTSTYMGMSYSKKTFLWDTCINSIEYSFKQYTCIIQKAKHPLLTVKKHIRCKMQDRRTIS